jgi:glyoxylase-like metal-dependent hydrolase (beta-lactamase superfamily II)/rhodanese-related sulfurtransferase
MYFKQFLDELCGCASYLIASRQTHEATIVDPALRIEQYEDLLHDRDFHLRYVIDTHIHADHVSGARRLAAHYGVPVLLHESARVSYPFQPLRDGEELELGQLRLRIVHTPGHRPELISILVVNPPRSPEPSMVLTGDSLLVGDVGRPDFGGGDADQQYVSLTRLLRLPDWVEVFPGHFEGPCGSGMCGRPTTTIGFERLYNPLARLERVPFVDSITRNVPARPLNMVSIERTNRGEGNEEWAMLTTALPVDEIPAADLHPDTKTFLLDVREPEEYAHGHVPGATNIPQAELADRLNEVPRDRPVLTICATGFRSLRSGQFLRQAGLENVRSVAGGTDAWRDLGRELISVGDVAEKPRIVESDWLHAGLS